MTNSQCQAVDINILKISWKNLSFFHRICPEIHESVGDTEEKHRISMSNGGLDHGKVHGTDLSSSGA